MRQLHRELRAMNLRRHSTADRLQQAIRGVESELHGSGNTLGYRSMTRRLASAHGVVVPRLVVSSILRVIDPEGVARRRNRIIDRRTYINKGPNYLIHIDGYDKLKKYGFPVHGAIDGYSRRILWFNVAISNNDPRIVATFFLKYLREIHAVPRCVRMDGGTENVVVQDIQKAFRWEHMDDMAAARSVIIGSSHSNQRIERWWRSARQSGCQSWIELFSAMESDGILSTANHLHIECMRFCFTSLLQQDLDKIRREWNQHTVRDSRNDSPGGKPDLLYNLPHLFGTVDYKVDVSPVDLQQVVNQYAVQRYQGNDQQIEARLNRIMSEKLLRIPNDTTEAMGLFGILVEAFT